MTAWERALRPSKSSNRWLFVLAAIAASVAAIVYFIDGADRLRFGSPRNAQGAPAPLPQRDATPTAGQPVRPPERRPMPRTQQVTKCVSPTGATTYSDGACPPGTKAGTTTVQPDINLADGMSPEARAQSLRSNSAVARSVVEHERRVAMNVDQAPLECPHLAAQIAAIDAATRQPLSGHEQDRLRNLRKQVRDRQFALRC
ncbi:hypothetical protein [Variovorax sp. JS1663]|uniref:hypothetical protein n=1 Tax=Variovorax sp. JS1663 TaxID=1851577 RepID=UPI000B349A00|nr:hypothetical protein [Variovorax sp. JS1663]OUM04451.1 hypothetical protein A8M77_01730 [Variovorax sp. JS1663]